MSEPEKQAEAGAKKAAAEPTVEPQPGSGTNTNEEDLALEEEDELLIRGGNYRPQNTGGRPT